MASPKMPVGERLARSLARPSNTSLAVGQAAVIAILTWFGAVISIALTARKGGQFVLISVVAVVLTAGLAFLARYVLIVRDRYVGERKDAIAFVHEQLDSIVVAAQSDILTGRAVARVPASPLEDVRRITTALYDFLDTKYQDTRLPGENVVLETVFMTKSYVDGLITICAWANTDRRMPKSLTMRQDQPNIYDRTVAAELYRESVSKRPEPRIIQDTESTLGYQQLYERQYQRIRSTVVCPVLSSESTIRGALVATADHPAFFRQSDAKYWELVFGVYAKRIALQMLRLDDTVKSGAKSPF
jgi:hypothetical protein